MKIVICGSIEFTPKIKEVADILNERGYEVDIPLTSQRIINGELTLEEFKKEKKQNGDGASRKIKDNVIKRHYDLINTADAILVLNLEKNGAANYIGGNTFLEMGFAYVLSKQIYLYNNIPDTSYTDEIVAMQPIILNGDLEKIK
ncbi:MAG: hypothetical protein WCX71_05405 [Candidatus Buchananbacteria bacterium]